MFVAPGSRWARERSDQKIVDGSRVDVLTASFACVSERSGGVVYENGGRADNSDNMPASSKSVAGKGDLLHFSAGRGEVKFLGGRRRFSLWILAVRCLAPFVKTNEDNHLEPLWVSVFVLFRLSSCTYLPSRIQTLRLRPLLVLCVCSACALLVRCLCSTCALLVLCLCSACALLVLCLCSACALLLLGECSACALRVLCLCVACALLVECSSYVSTSPRCYVKNIAVI